MFNTFKSKFSVLCEEATTRFNQSGVLFGDYVTIRPDALKSEYVKSKPQNFIDMVKSFINSDLPLKIGSVKSTRPESSNDLVGGAGQAATGTLVDVVQCLNPALFVNPITLPVELIDVVIPTGANWSPSNPESWKRKDDTQIEPIEVPDATGEVEHQTQGNKRKLATKDTKGISKGSAKAPKIEKAKEGK